MDIPQPPPDEETRNIIDRLANFVARNGVEFEGMTKLKQKDNPKFQFLFGGEYYNYYTYRVTSEQALLKHQATMRQQQQPQNFGSHFGSGSGPPRGGSPSTARGPSRFGPSIIQQPFERPPGFEQQQQRPQFQNYSGFSQGGGNFGNFDARGRNPFEQRSNFERVPFQGGPPGFDRNFERNPSIVPRRFDIPPRFEGPPGIRPNFENRHPVFERMRGPAPPQQQFGNSSNNFVPPAVVPVVLTPPTPPTPINVESLTTKKSAIQEQIRQSENNLSAQHQVLLSQQQTQVEEALRQAQDTEIRGLSNELGIDLNEFDTFLASIMESCTKESISNGKAWIFTHTATPRHYELITSHLLRKVTDPKLTFSQRLHIIYLVNDTLHHCVRRGAGDIQQSLERMVIPMFCFTKVTETDPENLSKLNKLYSLWESKPNYISKIAVEKLNNFSATWLEYKNALVQKYALIVTSIAGNIQKSYENYQSQHLLFVHHMNQNIKQIDQQFEDYRLLQEKYQIEHERYIQQKEQHRMEEVLREELRQETLHRQQEQLRQQQQIPVIQRPPQQSIIPGGGVPIPAAAPVGFPSTSHPMGQGFIPMQGLLGDKPPPAQINPEQDLLDLTRPPPGFNNNTGNLEVPSLPYFELPAGLMVPLVQLDDDNYKPIDPKSIRLPPPCQPSERLMQAVEAFYGPPSHDNPRDSEGWERLGLYEYYKQKNLARKQKEDDIREGRREKSRSPSPIIKREMSPSGRSPPVTRRRYSSKSPTPPTTTPTKRRRSPRSPNNRRGGSGSRRSRRSRSRSPIRRSPTPPSFGSAGLGLGTSKLDESNKGHQLLKKMGWGGTGLGANEQGIEAPIDGGELRERKDQYKGVGINLNDPFESYRKTKGQAFVDRMRQRAEERP